MMTIVLVVTGSLIIGGFVAGILGRLAPFTDE